MNKQDLVEAVAKATGLSKVDVDRAIKATVWNISAALSKGDKVTLVGFGTFERRHRKERIGVNPQKPQVRITIPAKKAAAFAPGSELKAAVNSGKVPAFDLEPIVKKVVWVEPKVKAAVKSKAKEKVWAKAKPWEKPKAKVKAVKASSKTWAKSRAARG